MDLGNYSIKYNNSQYLDEDQQLVFVIQNIEHPSATVFDLNPNTVDLRTGKAFSRLLWVNPINFFSRKLPPGALHPEPFDWANGFIWAKVILSTPDGHPVWERRRIPSDISLFNFLHQLDSSTFTWTGFLDLPTWATTLPPRSQAHGRNTLHWTFPLRFYPLDLDPPLSLFDSDSDSS